MDGYHVALFLHFCALISAIAATSVIHIGTVRRDRARTLAEALEWHNTAMATSKTFPIAVATLVLSGSYMLRGSALWSSGFVVAGLTGVGMLLLLGMVLSIKGRAMKQRIEQAIRDEGPSQAPTIPRDPVVGILQNIPVGIVLAVMFDMTTKPSVGSSLGVIGLGVAVGAVVGSLLRPTPVPGKVPQRG